MCLECSKLKDSGASACSLPQVAGRMECSNKEFEEHCRFYIGVEQEKISPDNGLIAVLCDGARIAREYSEAMNKEIAGEVR